MQHNAAQIRRNPNYRWYTVQQATPLRRSLLGVSRRNSPLKLATREKDANTNAKRAKEQADVAIGRLQDGAAGALAQTVGRSVEGSRHGR